MVPLIVLLTPLKKCNLHALLKSSSWRLMLFLKKKKKGVQQLVPYLKQPVDSESAVFNLYARTV